MSRTALLLTDVLAKELKEKFELLAEFLLPAVLKLTARANKVYVTSAHSTLLTCIDATQGLAFLIPLLVESRKSPSKTLRITAGACLVKIADIAPLCKLEPFVEKIEDSIRHNILDSVPEVRELARSLFEVFSLNFEHRVHRYVILFMS